MENWTADMHGMEEKQCYRIGAIAAFALGIGYVIIFPLYAQVGAPPSGGEAWFRYLPGKTTIWWAILWLSVFTDFLYVPIAFALYRAFHRGNRNLMPLAAAFIGLFVVLDLAVTWSHYASILTLYRSYSTVSDNTRRAAYVAATDYASAMLTSPLEIVYAIVTLSFGILLIGCAMLRSRFSTITAYLALITGMLGIASLTGLGVAIIGNALFATAWLFFVGHGLWRFASQPISGATDR